MLYSRININLILCTLSLCLFSNPVIAKGIDFFQGSWSDAKNLAIKLNKPLFVEAYSNNCLLCKQIEEHTFKQEEVGSFYNDNFINVKVNVDEAEGISFRKNYNVRILPDLIFLDPMGYPIYRDLGDKDQVQLLTLAHKVIQTPLNHTPNSQNGSPSVTSPKTILETMKEQHAAGLENSRFLYDYAYELKKHNEPYTEIVNTYLSRIKKDKLKHPQNLLFIYDFSNDLQTHAMDILLQFRSIFEAKYGYAHITNRVKSAALSNASIAAKTQNQKLFRRTKQVIQKAQLEDDERMFFLVETIFHKESQNWREYIALVKEYIHKHGVRNPHFLQQKAQDILTYSDEIKDLDAAKKWLETSLFQIRNYESYNTYAHVLFKLGNLHKAEKVARKAVEYASSENKYALSAKSLIDDIQNYTTSNTLFNRPIKL